MSHALRVRGLKRRNAADSRLRPVARSTRAWIETSDAFLTSPLHSVARSTRAWIETSSPFIPARVQPSHALRVRGLKQVKTDDKVIMEDVARSTRAWIETYVWDKDIFGYSSHALRVRGLKHEAILQGAKGNCRTLYACVD